jgi:ketosteroid isomerase-like protein
LRRGLVLSGGAAAVLLSREATARMPAALLSATVKTASLFVAGKTTTSGAITSNVAALTEGVLKAMLLSKVKTVLGIGVVVGLVLLGSTFGYQAMAQYKVPAAENKNQLRDTLLVLDNQWWEALSKYDVDTHGKLLADDWVGFDPGGAHWTRARYVEFYRDVRVRDVKFLSERDVFRINEHTAIMTYEVKFRGEKRDGTPAGNYHQRNIACWVQRDGGWFVKYAQCIALPDPVPAAKVEAKPWETEILLDPRSGPQVVPWPPGVKIEPAPYLSGPWTINPLAPGSGIELLDPSKLIPLDASKLFPLTDPPSKRYQLADPAPEKPAVEPKGTGKGAGNPNADKAANKP